MSRRYLIDEQSINRLPVGITGVWSIMAPVGPFGVLTGVGGALQERFQERTVIADSLLRQ